MRTLDHFFIQPLALFFHLDGCSNLIKKETDFYAQDVCQILLSRQDFICRGVDMTYGTIRFIESDEESFLPWAHAYAGRQQEGPGRFSPDHRSGDRVWRAVLFHLSPVSDEGIGRDVRPAIFEVPRREADARSRMPVLERLVSALRDAVWPGLTRDDFTRRAACFSESPSVSM